MYANQEARVRSKHGTMDWFRIGKGVHQSCVCHPDYLTCMQSTSCRMLGWMKNKLESRLPGEITKTSYTQTKGELKQKRIKEPLDESERGE